MDDVIALTMFQYTTDTFFRQNNVTYGKRQKAEGRRQKAPRKEIDRWFAAFVVVLTSLALALADI
ncbi:MAG: hypothetical protein F6K41_07820 [Symploca sp. SIO3E6]|nr:hypothetical protein [Caldora sp. SIO3E6]